MLSPKRGAGRTVSNNTGRATYDIDQYTACAINNTRSTPETSTPAATMAARAATITSSGPQAHTSPQVEGSLEGTQDLPRTIGVGVAAFDDAPIPGLGDLGDLVGELRAPFEDLVEFVAAGEQERLGAVGEQLGVLVGAFPDEQPAAGGHLEGAAGVGVAVVGVQQHQIGGHRRHRHGE